MGYIYKITNTVNGKAYIGKSVHDPENGRIKAHLSGRAKQCRAIHNAIKKYGKDAFVYEILYQGVFDELLSGFEIQAIKDHNTVAPNGYNLTYGGEGVVPSGETRRKISESNKGKKLSEAHKRKIIEVHTGRKASEETRQKMSKAHKGKVVSAETRQKLSDINKGKGHTPETRQKLSKSLKGRTPWNKGKKMSDFGIVSWNKGKKMSVEHRRKLSQAQKGVKKKPRSPEHCRNLSEAQKGKIVSKETRKKISEAHKGRPSGRKGVKLSAEHRRKLSEAHKGKPSPRKGKKASPETRRRISEAGKGRITSAETRKKMSKAHKSRYAEKRLPYKEFYLSLPPDMSITEKRKRVKEFSGKDAKTVWRWINQWQSEIK